MKNRILVAFLAMVLIVPLVTFGACAKEEEAPPVVEEEEPPVVEEEEPPVVEEVWEWPDKLTIVSLSAAAVDYVQIISWTTPLARDTGMQIRMVCEEGDLLRWRWMKEKRFFLFSFATEPHTKLEAIDESATRDGGPFQVRSLWPIMKAGYGFAVRGDSPINTPRDIKPGARIAYMPMFPHSKTFLIALLAWAGLTEEDVVWVTAGSMDRNTRLLIEGTADIAYGWPMSPIWLESEAAPHGQKWIDLNPNEDPEGWQRWDAVLPGVPLVSFETVGVPSAQGVWMPLYLARFGVHAEADPELVYHVIKWLTENYDKYKDANPNNVYMTLENCMLVADTDYVPLHDGVVKYLKEIGQWTEAHEKRRQQQIDLITRYVEAYETAIDMADDQGITVDVRNEEWLELWENYKKELGLPKFHWFVGLD